jgi:hypothetical protein
MGPICAVCRMEMKIVKTGRVVRWGKSWCKVGDEYKCPVCAGRVVVDFGREGFENSADLGVFLEMPGSAE